QSSSVTVSIILLMCNQGLLEIPISLYIILGCNIGACASAVLASLAGKKDAKRAAMIHLLFNIIGTIVAFFVFQVAIDPIVSGLASISNDNPGRMIANAHTIIKVTQVIVLLPFLTPIVKLAAFVVPGTDQSINYREKYELKYIGNKVVFNPATAVVDVLKEVERMANLADENLNRAMNALITLDEEDINEVYEVEKNINFLNKSITNYLVTINQTTLPIEDLKSLGALFHVVNDIERIGDHAENMADAAKRRKEQDLDFSKEAIGEMNEMLTLVNALIRLSVETLHNVTDEHVEDALKLEEAVDEKERELQQAHVDRLTKNECTPEAGMLFSDVVSGLERVGDHATNIILYLNKTSDF
nr:Na/Pi symporter [Lachnospiraceae bacterium]